MVNTASYRDGHTRPRALAFNPDDGLLYVALSTSDEIAVVDPAAAPPRVLARKKVCGFPDAIAALPGGGAIVACRFDPGLRRVRRGGARRLARDRAGGGIREAARAGWSSRPTARWPTWRRRRVGGIKVVSLAGRGGVVQTLATGVSPRALRIVPAGTLPRQDVPLLLVSNFIDHTVTVHAVGADGRLGDARQTIRTEAPVLDIVVAGAPAALLLFTHEDRPIDRAHLSVEGLDSGVIVLRASAGARRGGARRSTIRGPGKRTFINLGERAAPVIELASAASADAVDDRRRGRGDRQPADRDGRRSEGRGRPSRWARILRPSRRCRAGAS